MKTIYILEVLLLKPNILVLLLMILLHITHFSLTLPNFVKRVSTCPMPKNFSEWKRAASRLGCDNFENAPYVYHCMPSSFLNETVEFCGRNVPHVGGSCPIYTYKFEENKAPNFRNCSEFKSGCPNKFYFSKMIYKYPACLDIIKDRMCYKADPSCCSNMSCSRPILSTNGGTNGSTEKWALVGSLLTLGAIIVTIVIIFKKCNYGSVCKNPSNINIEAAPEQLSLAQFPNGEARQEKNRVQTSKDKDVLEGNRSETHRLWRKFHDKEQFLTERVWKMIKKQLITLKPPDGIKYFNILMLGPSGTGKSSFVNTCITAVSDDGEMHKVASVGANSISSVTMKLRPYCLQYEKDKNLPIRLFDCRGILEADSIALKEIELIIKGFIKSHSVIKTASQMKEDKMVYRDDPDIRNSMHCVVFTIRADKAINCIDEFKDLQIILEDLGIPLCILFTAIDRIGGASDNVEGVFLNKNVEEECKRLGENLNFEFINILPMSNFHDEYSPKDSKNALALINLKWIVDRAVDHLYQKQCVDKDFYD